MKMLGIIGGMGPEASEVFYSKINASEKAEKDQDHINILLYSHASIPDRSAYILSGREEELWRVFQKDVQLLKTAGCAYLAIPCNTSHYFADRFNKEMSGNFISMIEETAAYIAGKGMRKVGVLATDGTRSADLYGKALKKYDCTCMYPSLQNQKKIMSIIYDEIKKGQKGDCAAFMNIAYEMKQQGCECVILACTELSVLKNNYAALQGPYYLDAMDVLTKACIEKCGGNYSGILAD